MFGKDPLIVNAHCKHSLLPVLMLLVAACDGSGQAGAPGTGRGEAYLRHCASCHGVEGEGRAPTFPPLAGSEWIDFPPRALGAIVLLGLRGEIEVAGRSYRGFMPPLQHIGDAELAAIVNFTKAEWADETLEWTADDVAVLRSDLAGRGMLEGRTDLERLLESLP